MPEQFNARDFKQNINEDAVQKLIDKFTLKPQLFTDNVNDLVKLLLPEHDVPTTPNEALHLYKKLLLLIAEHRD